MIQGTCKLCNTQSDLCGSHIIPDFVFRHLKKKSEQIIVNLNRPEPTAYFYPKTYKEPLLCKKCEKELKVFEDYICKFIYDDEFLINETKGINYHKNINPDLFNKYILSILWRAAVAQGEMWENVELESSLCDKIKCILNGESESDLGLVPCMIIKYYDELITKFNEDIDLDTIIFKPYKNGPDINRKIIFVYSGFMWIYFLNPNGLPSNKNKFLLKPNGKLSIKKESVWKLRVFHNTFANAILNSKKIGKFAKIKDPT